MKCMQERILALIDERAEDIIKLARDIYEHPEPGFREFRTADKVREFLQGLGLDTRNHIAVTGVKAWQRMGEGPSVALMGELDGIACPRHPFADKATGISHACGHHMQIAAMAGAACALSDPEVREQLSGTVQYWAVPAEEFIGASDLEALMKEGLIQSCCGKSELLIRGELDDSDLVITSHAHMVSGERPFFLLGNHSANGFISKTITLTGRASHAATAPEKGINALDAATVGMTALGLLRSTFADEDFVRVHPIIREGGSAVNVVPDRVVLETQVRAKSKLAMEDAGRKTDQAFRGGAAAIGAGISIENRQGYLPVIPSQPASAQISAARLLEGEADWLPVDLAEHNAASTDAGDLTHVKPVLNFTYGGFTGALHSQDFRIAQEARSYILPAKLMALTVYELLSNQGREAKNVIAGFSPFMTMEEYKSYVQGFHGGQR